LFIGDFFPFLLGGKQSAVPIVALVALSELLVRKVRYAFFDEASQWVFV